MQLTTARFACSPPERVPDLAEVYSPDPDSGRLAVNQELRLAFRESAPFPSGSDVPGPDGEYRGCGFGLGFSAMTDPVGAGAFGNKGEFGWSGAANTHFFVDPADGVTAVFCTQVVTWGKHRTPIRRQLRNLVYQAMT
ncbi:hypothetical protein ACQ86D_08075 [Streptomyces galilaeus]